MIFRVATQPYPGQLDNQGHAHFYLMMAINNYDQSDLDQSDVERV